MKDDNTGSDAVRHKIGPQRGDVLPGELAISSRHHGSGYFAAVIGLLLLLAAFNLEVDAFGFWALAGMGGLFAAVGVGLIFTEVDLRLRPGGYDYRRVVAGRFRTERSATGRMSAIIRCFDAGTTKNPDDMSQYEVTVVADGKADRSPIKFGTAAEAIEFGELLTDHLGWPIGQRTRKRLADAADELQARPGKRRAAAQEGE